MRSPSEIALFLPLPFPGKSMTKGAWGRAQRGAAATKVAGTLRVPSASFGHGTRSVPATILASKTRFYAPAMQRVPRLSTLRRLGEPCFSTGPPRVPSCIRCRFRKTVRNSFTPPSGRLPSGCLPNPQGRYNRAPSRVSSTLPTRGCNLLLKKPERAGSRFMFGHGFRPEHGDLRTRLARRKERL
jgi:hypothetical protein